MPRYRLLPLDSRSQITGSILERRCATDAEALLLAMDVMQDHAAVEVWAEERIVGRVTARDVQAMHDRMRGREPALLVNRGMSARPEHSRSALL